MDVLCGERLVRTSQGKELSLPKNFRHYCRDRGLRVTEFQAVSRDVGNGSGLVPVRRCAYARLLVIGASARSRA